MSKLIERAPPGGSSLDTTYKMKFRDDVTKNGEGFPMNNVT